MKDEFFKDKSPSIWWVYVLCSTSNRTYVGSTTDPLRRTRQHNGEIAGGAKCTRAHRPWRLSRVYGPYDTRSLAFKAEIALKRGKRSSGRLNWSEKDSSFFIDSDEARAFTFLKNSL
jgi:putative endonuclease